MLKPKTVDSLLSKFSKLKADLEAVAAQAQRDAEEYQVQIDTLAKRREGAMVERERALAAAAKVSEFVV
jgi:hypothetical protein